MQPNTPLLARNATIERLKSDKDTLGSYARVGRKYGVSGALIWRIVVQGYEPKDQEIRDRLGLPPYVVHEYVVRLWSDGTQTMTDIDDDL